MPPPPQFPLHSFVCIPGPQLPLFSPASALSPSLPLPHSNPLSSSQSWGPGLESLMFASSFCYGFWIQHIWIPGPRCVVATATLVPLVNIGAHPPQNREQNNCVTFFCHEIEMSSLLPSPHTRVSRQRSFKGPNPSFCGSFAPFPVLGSWFSPISHLTGCLFPPSPLPTSSSVVECWSPSWTW